MASRATEMLEEASEGGKEGVEEDVEDVDDRLGRGGCLGEERGLTAANSG